MVTGDIKRQVDQVWNAFWSGGVSNPLTVIEQITYLLFAKRLDELETVQEAAEKITKVKSNRRYFAKDQQNLRWSRFKDFAPKEMFEIFRDQVFPFMKSLHKDEDSAYSRFLKDAVFMIPTPSLLDRVVELIDKIPMEDRDTKGDLYEYMLNKIASAGQNGQFRTPRHIIKMMVELTAPEPNDTIADPACGTCGYLVAAGEYLREKYSDILHNKKTREHFSNDMFHGSDFDASMLRIGAMNMMLHGVEHPDIDSYDSLSEDAAHIRDRHTLILANPPFKGSINHEEVAKDLLQITRTKKTELLFLALFILQLKVGGRCACIVPDGVLFGSSKGHTDIRKHIVDGHKLDAIISMPSGVFKPYAGVSTAIMIFTRTDSGGTDKVWFYDMTADGFSLDDKRDTIEANDIPDIIKKYHSRKPKGKNDRKAKSFFVPVDEIRENKYDLSINRYKEIEYEEVQYEKPAVILDQIETLEKEITSDLKKLRRLLK